MNKWVVKNTDAAQTAALAKATGIPRIICELLCSRGICDEESAKDYFNNNELFDPLLITDMQKAAQILDEAVINGEKITVYGDYDCDGVTATVMLYSHLDAIGAQADYYIPSREEGYGLNKNAVRKIADGGTSLIVTVDNGISAQQEAELIYELGMKLIITDHHQPPQTLPRAEAIVDPHRTDDTSPYKELAGCGLALKLIMALEQDADGVLEQYADLAAIGTIGDIVPITGENRVIVRRGLKNMAFSENEGLLALISAAGLSCENMTSHNVAFGLCPRINAAGRYGNAKTAAELFLAQSASAANAKAGMLCDLNEKRKAAENDILEKAKEQLKTHPQRFNARIIVVWGEGWHHGVIGVVSARLTELYGKPSFVIGIENGEARGSARSVEGFSIYSALDACGGCLTKFGGHTMAGGFSLSPDRINEFYDTLRRYADEKYPRMPIMTEEADAQPQAADIDVPTVEKLNFMQPFGEQNPAPLFLMRECAVQSVSSLKNGRYTSFTADYQGKIHKLLCFKIPFADFPYKSGDKVDVLANFDINEYNGEKTVSIKVKDIRGSDFRQDEFFAYRNIYEKIIRGEKIEPAIRAKVMPTKENMRLPFDIIRKEKNIWCGAQKAMKNGVNYCLYMMCLHIFAEFGHLSLDRTAGTMSFLSGGRRIDTAQSKVVKHITDCTGG